MPAEQASAPTLRFDCPSCGATLTVPGAVAGLEGPCPKCWQTIISPDPARRLPARLPIPAAADKLPALPMEGAPQAGPADGPRPPDQLPPAAAEPAAPIRRRRPRSLSFALWLLTALIFSSGGYFLGKTDRTLPWKTAGPVAKQPEQPAPDPDPNPVAVITPDPEPVPLAVITPDPDPDPVAVINPEPAPPPAPVPPPPAWAAAEAALRAFLEAPDWQARLSHVLAADEVAPAMQKYAEDHGDGPIPVQSIGFIEASAPNHIFKVCTSTIPEGFPVAVTETDMGLMIDWESFIGFHDDLFRNFLGDPADKSGIFDLLVRPDPDQSGEGNPNFARYHLSVPMPNREAVAWIRRDSVAHARLLAIFHGSGGFDQETIDRLGDVGIPMVLAVAQRSANDQRRYLEIEDFVAIGWGPADP